MKVLHIINSFEGGGAEKLTLQIHGMYLEQGLDSHAVSILRSSAGSLPNTYCLNFDHPYQLSVLLKLYQFLRQPQWKSLDVIHTHLFPSQLFAPILSRLSGVKATLITTEHSTSNTRRRIAFGKLIDRVIYAFYTKIICISAATSTALSSWQPHIVNKLAIIHNGINLYDYADRFQLQPRQKFPVIISVGRLVKAKNYETAIRALHQLCDRPFEYWIVGSGALESELKHLVDDLNLTSKVKFLGFRTDIPKLLYQADIFLLTSSWEGFGLAAVEAMAAGLPVVVSDVPGLQEVVSSTSHAGFLVNPQSPDEIAEHIEKLLLNPDLRHEMGANAKIQAAQFDIQTTVRKHLQLYTQVLQARS